MSVSRLMGKLFFIRYSRISAQEGRDSTRVLKIRLQTCKTVMQVCAAAARRKIDGKIASSSPRLQNGSFIAWLEYRCTTPRRRAGDFLLRRPSLHLFGRRMDNPGNEAPSASADLPAVEAMQVENPTPPDVSAGNGKEGNDANVSPGKPTPMDTDSLSTGQTAERVSNANALIAASSNTSASASALSSAQAAASAAPTTTVGTNSSSTPSAAIIYTHACFLCCRKFTSLEQLLKHQAKSKLHKTNLEREKSLKKEKKSDAGQDAQAEKGDDSSDDSDRDDEEDEDSDADSDIADGTSSSPRSSKRKHKLSQRPSSKPRRPSVRSRVEVEGPVQVWRCSSCNDAYFDTYEEAFEHEARCARQARRESSMVDSSSEGDSIARAEAKERNALEKKKWKEEDDQLKAKGVEQGGKGVPFNLTAEDKKILSDYNRFLFENIEMFVVDQEFNDQLATS